MSRYLLFVAAAALGLAANMAAIAAAQSDSTKPFPVAQARFEQNATDGDVEVVFEVTAQSEGLTKLTILSPDGRTVVDFQAPDTSTLGIRQFVFESPEPRDAKIVKAAYPEGEYTFTGTTASGDPFRSKTELRHDLPSPTSFVSPAADARDLPATGLRIAWTPTVDAEGYIVEIEAENSPVQLTATLPGSAMSFPVPDDFLRADQKYSLAIGSVGRNGNISYIEMSFRTAAQE